LPCSFVGQKINPRDFTVDTPRYSFSWLAGDNKHLCWPHRKKKTQNNQTKPNSLLISKIKKPIKHGGKTTQKYTSTEIGMTNLSSL